MSPALAWLLVSGSVIPSMAGAEPDRAGAWQAIFRGTAEVEVLELEVRVTDASGRPVQGLVRDDFELRADGEIVPIDHFYAVEAGEARRADPGGSAPAGPRHEVSDAALPAAAPQGQPRHVILYFDGTDLAPLDRSRVVERTRRFLAERELGAASWMIVGGDRDLVVAQGPSTDRGALLEALARVAGQAGSGLRADLDRRRLLRVIEAVDVEAGSGIFGTKDQGGALFPPGGGGAEGGGGADPAVLRARTAAEARGALSQIQGHADQRLQQARTTVAVLAQLIDLAAGLPGRATVLHVSGGLPLRPAAELYEAFARRVEALGDPGLRSDIDAASGRNDLSRELGALAERANGAGVTFHTLDAAAAALVEAGSAASTGGSGGNFGDWDDGLETAARADARQGLRLLAEETGGTFSASLSDPVLDDLLVDLGSHYSLGFVPAEAASGPIRLQVSVRDPQLTVRHRRAVLRRPLAERTAEKTRAALVIDGFANPFGIELEAADAPPGRDHDRVVTLTVRVPVAELVLVPGPRVHEAKVSLFVAVRDAAGRTSDVQRHLCPVRIPNADLLGALGHTTGCGVRLAMRPGPHRIAASVLDELSFRDSTGVVEIDAAPSPDGPVSDR